MTHSELQLQIDALVDGELSSEDAREVEAHLETCGDCAQLRQDRVALATAIKQHVPAWSAPEELRTRVRAGLARASRDATRRRVVPASGWTWLGLAASLAFVALGSWQLASNRAAAAGVRDQVLAGHLRSLLPGHLTDVASSDQHTVKPWFNGRLDYSPPVVDLQGRGFPLLGGRLDYVGGRTVATLVYGRRKHLISVFLWPTRSAEASGRASQTIQGYHLLHWVGPDYVYWVVSDLGAAELAQFAELLRQSDYTAATTGTQ
jgi:anti-sigma factor RsiW